MSSILHESSTSDPPHLRVVLADPSAGLVKQYFGSQSGVVGTGAYATILVLPTEDHTNYTITFAHSFYITAGSDVNGSYSQISNHNIKNRGGGQMNLFLWMSNINNSDGISTNAVQNLVQDGTIPTTINIQMYLEAANTYNLSWWVTVQKSS